MTKESGHDIQATDENEAARRARYLEELREDREERSDPRNFLRGPDRSPRPPVVEAVETAVVKPRKDAIARIIASTDLVSSYMAGQPEVVVNELTGEPMVAYTSEGDVKPPDDVIEREIPTNAEGETVALASREDLETVHPRDFPHRIAS